MIHESEIFDILEDDTNLSVHIDSHTFFFTFFEMYIRSNTNLARIYRTIYSTNWMVNSGLDETRMQYYENKDTWMTKCGLCEIDMIGPFRNPKVTRVHSNYSDMQLHHVHIIRIEDTGKLIL